jgi:hypothetical protein
MRSEIRNSRIVHLLVMNDFVNKFTMNGMNSMKFMYIIYKELFFVYVCQFYDALISEFTQNGI